MKDYLEDIVGDESYIVTTETNEHFYNCATLNILHQLYRIYDDREFDLVLSKDKAYKISEDNLTEDISSIFKLIRDKMR